MPQFERYLGIDYSGAKTPTCSLKELRLYAATSTQPPGEVLPPPSPRRYWTRRGLAEWLATELRDGPPTLVGINHAFSCPLRYFEAHNTIPRDWPLFLDDFQHHWPTDDEHIYVDFIRTGSHGNGGARSGDPRWRRLCEIRSGAQPVFHFHGKGSVAKSTHSGLPWLRYLRKQLGERVHFWPFDGWTPPPNRSVIAEVHPALWIWTFPVEDRNPHQHAAYSVARWMQETESANMLTSHFDPPLGEVERTRAELEGWILGIARHSGNHYPILPPLGAARLPASTGVEAAFAQGLRRAKSGSAPCGL